MATAVPPLYGAWSARRSVARRWYDCIECGGLIRPGDTYFRRYGRMGEASAAWTARMCDACEARWLRRASVMRTCGVCMQLAEEFPDGDGVCLACALERAAQEFADFWRSPEGRQHVARAKRRVTARFPPRPRPAHYEAGMAAPLGWRRSRRDC